MSWYHKYGWVWQTIDDFGASTLDLGLEITNDNGNMRCCVEGKGSSCHG